MLHVVMNHAYKSHIKGALYEDVKVNEHTTINEEHICKVSSYKVRVLPDHSDYVQV